MTSPYETGVVGTYPISGSSQIDPLVWLAFKWGSSGAGTPATVTYSFPLAGAAWHTDYATYLDNEPFNGNFQPFTAAQQTAAKQALALWAEVANITFVQVADTPTNVGDIRFGNSKVVTSSDSAAWAYTPYDDDSGAVYPENGDIWFDKAYAPNLQLAPGQAGLATMLHEIGHAIGLDHPFYDGYSGEPILPSNLDTDQYTVMSYTAELSTRAYASTPQLLDILAIQYIYGANMNTRTGNDVYKFSTAEVNKTIWDAGGIDTLDFSNQGGAPVLGTLQEGSFFRFGGYPANGTSSTLGIAFGVTIENVIASHRGSNIAGNDLANRMIGGNGADEFDARGGDDHLEGRGGNDFLRGGAGKNLQDGGVGNDTLWGGVDSDTLLGGAGIDVLLGYEGDDYIDGGIGNDEMVGAAGNDTYVVNSVADVVYEWIYTDTDDRILSSVSLSLLTFGGGAIEHAALLGTSAINLTGNDENNELKGNAGANKLDGGIGADIMFGGKGADIYTVDDIGDQVVEDVAGAAGGSDTVISYLNYELGANVEKLSLAGGNIYGLGNTLNNTLIGSAGNNRLDGWLGNDTMTGGAGSDTYVVDSLLDVVNETITNGNGGGIDTVESSITFSLATRANIDNLTLTGGGNINGTGNALANTIIGNGGNNILDGGVGADILKGGAGNDTYVFDNLEDTATEDAASGTDELKTKVKIAVGLANIENYTYIGTGAWGFTGTGDDNRISGGAANDALNGGEGKDTLLGNGGNDSLIGAEGDDLLDGGLGNDKMQGGTGNDIYVISALTDVIDEQGGDADDLLRSSVSVSLASFLGIEHVELLGAAAKATGNSDDNKLTGNAAANSLDGKEGADTMTGGNGADTYTVDNVGDLVVETTGGAPGGIDLVLSSITYTLGDNVEKLTLAVGAGDIDGTGNTLYNTLLGNEGANVLNGGAGNDTMTGGKGDDTYIVNVAGDVVNETVLNSAGGGVDTVQSAVTFTLATRTNIEHLTLTGSANINGTGNALNNEIIGNSGNNTLNGGAGNDFLHGGDGQDSLIGGTGIDTFDYDVLSEAGDTISGFTRGLGGDVLNLADLLEGFTIVGDVFNDGYLNFFASAGNTIVQLDSDGGMNNVVTLTTLLNVTLLETDTSNFVLTIA